MGITVSHSAMLAHCHALTQACGYTEGECVCDLHASHTGSSETGHCRSRVSYFHSLNNCSQTLNTPYTAAPAVKTLLPSSSPSVYTFKTGFGANVIVISEITKIYTTKILKF